MSISSSNLVPLDSLCIHKGKAAWVLYVDATCINYDGNAFDATLLAMVAALRNSAFAPSSVIRLPFNFMCVCVAKLPQATYNPETHRTICSRSAPRVPLRLAAGSPIGVSFGIFDGCVSSTTQSKSSLKIFISNLHAAIPKQKICPCRPDCLRGAALRGDSMCRTRRGGLYRIPFSDGLSACGERGGLRAARCATRVFAGGGAPACGASACGFWRGRVKQYIQKFPFDISAGYERSCEELCEAVVLKVDGCFRDRDYRKKCEVN